MSGGREAKLRSLDNKEQQRRLSKEELLQPRKVVQDVEVAGLGGTVRIQSLSHRTRQELRERAGFGSSDFDDNVFTLLSIVESLVEPKLTEKDIEELAEQDATIIDELILAVSTVNMFGRQEDLKKESEPTPN